MIVELVQTINWKLQKKNFLKIDFKVDYSDIDFLDDWQLIGTIASAQKDILKIIGNAFIKAFCLMQEHNVDKEMRRPL